MLINSRNLEMKTALRNAISFDTQMSSEKQHLNLNSKLAKASKGVFNYFPEGFKLQKEGPQENKFNSNLYNLNNLSNAKNLKNLKMQFPKTPSQKIKASTNIFNKFYTLNTFNTNHTFHTTKVLKNKNEKTLKFQLKANLNANVNENLSNLKNLKHLKEKYLHLIKNKRDLLNKNDAKSNSKEKDRDDHNRYESFQKFEFIKNLWSSPNKPYFLCALARDIYNDNQRISVQGNKIKFSNNSSCSGKISNVRKHFRVHSTISNSSKGNYSLLKLKSVPLEGNLESNFNFNFNSNLRFNSYFNFNSDTNSNTKCNSETKNKRNAFELNVQTHFLAGRDQCFVPFSQTFSENKQRNQKISLNSLNMENFRKGKEEEKDKDKEKEKEKTSKNNLKIQKILINLPPVVILKEAKV